MRERIYYGTKILDLKEDREVWKWCDKNRGYIPVLGTGATIYVGLQIANRLDQIEDRLDLIKQPIIKF